MRGCWYYIKLRPGLEDFLQNVAELYELHIYTMGTRAYAQNIADIIDPTRKLFGDRILSRDESGSLTAKNLQRLFPVDTKMVVIIDDRGDVWRWSPNLIKVSPYDFFVGIGDINSSFLPKKQDIGETNKAVKAAKEKEKQAKQEQANGEAEKARAENNISALEQLVTMGGGDDPSLLKEQANAQEETIMHQVEDRPLLQKQKELDAEDDASADGSDSSSSVDESQDAAKQRHHLLDDHDKELYQLQDRLEQVHTTFFEEYDKKRTHALGGRVAALRGEKAAHKDRDVDLKLVPDIKDIMPLFKRSVLGGVVLVFSGVLPLGTDTQNADISLWAKSFGVVIATKINARTTHLVAGRNRTAKVREATRYPNVKIVTTQWLLDSLTSWKHLDEDPYLLPVHPDDRGEPLSPGSLELAESSWLSSSDEATGSLFAEDEGNEEMFKSSGLDETSTPGYDEDELAAVHDELKEFLGSDDESESDSEAWGEESNEGSKKRKRGEGIEGGGEEESGEDDGDESDPKGSRLSQRIKRSYERSTGLREVATATSSGSESERARPSGPHDDEPDAEKAGTKADADDGYPEDPDDDDDELEREMLAAFEDDNPQAEEEAAAENG
jgi:RNA polymerase II subunit A-like phosphatase